MSEPVVTKIFTPELGAMIDGIDPFRPIEAEQQAILRNLLVRYKVLIFDGRAWGALEILRLAQVFGRLPETLWTARTHIQSDKVEVIEADAKSPGKANIWHADSTWKRVPPAGAVLQPEIIPPHGGDTIWVSMSHVFARLSPRLQDYLIGLEAVHTLAQAPGFQERFLTPEEHQNYSEILRVNPPAVHPVVIRHPASEVPTLFLNETYTHRILGLPRAESEMIMNHVRCIMSRPEHQFRLRWTPGTVVVWDNCATQHYAVSDYAPHLRRMSRVAFEFSESVSKLLAYK